MGQIAIAILSTALIVSWLVLPFLVNRIRKEVITMAEVQAASLRDLRGVAGNTKATAERIDKLIEHQELTARMLGKISEEIRTLRGSV